MKTDNRCYYCGGGGIWLEKKYHLAPGKYVNSRQKISLKVCGIDTQGGIIVVLPIRILNGGGAGMGAGVGRFRIRGVKANVYDT